MTHMLPAALRIARRWLLATLLAAQLPLAACSLLPSAGPDRGEIDDQRQTAAFELVDIGAGWSLTDTAPAPAGFAERFGSRSTPPPSVIGIGDGVSIDIWEAGTDALFSPRLQSATAVSGAAATGRYASLAEQIVALDGSVTLPYAGRIQVVGLTVAEVEQRLTAALAGKAAQPQLVVRVRNNSGTVTVAGDVAGGARVPLSVRGERVLDVLAAVGGVRAATHETRLQLTRRGESVTLPLLRVLQEPHENIYLEPGDLLVATRQTQSFTAFGATGRNAQIEFGAERLSLIEAVAKTGGLLDSRADPRGVYLFRTETRAALDALRAAPSGASGAAQEEVRVVYRLDLAKAASYFVAQRFAMRDRDIVYVSSAATNELQKFLELVGLVTQPVIQGAVVRGALQ